jgi:SAM-dependent methyltransferase
MSADSNPPSTPRPALSKIDHKRIRALNQILLHAAIERRAEINEEILRVAGPVVARGPFKDTRLPIDTSWGEGDFSPKVLGSYEEELHPAIERAIAREPVRVVNVGCAEGYYAIGLARRLPKAQVLAFDIDPKAQAICREAAAANGVAERLTVEGACTSERLRALATQHGPTLVFMDCEGAELDLLDEPTVAALANSDLIVECHDFINRAITPTLTRRFAGSHAVETFAEGARDPNRFAQLRTLGSLDRWLAVCEFRPEQMRWLACWSRAGKDTSP